MTAVPRAGSGRRSLLLIAVAVAAPVLLSYAFYYLFPRSSFSNYGELLPTAPMPGIAGTRSDGTPFRLSQEKGHWTIVIAAPAPCADACERALYATRQARTMQGRERERVQRVWLVTGDAPSPAVLAEHPDVLAVRVDEAALRALPRGSGAIHLVDPLGNQVLAWPRDPDIKALAKDLSRVLKASRIG